MVITDGFNDNMIMKLITRSTYTSRATRCIHRGQRLAHGEDSFAARREKVVFKKETIFVRIKIMMCYDKLTLLCIEFMQSQTSS